MCPEGRATSGASRNVRSAGSVYLSASGGNGTPSTAAPSAAALWRGTWHIAQPIEWNNCSPRSAAAASAGSSTAGTGGANDAT